MKLMLLIVVFVLSGSAFAQKHMVEFNADSILLGQFAFKLTKDRADQNAEETKTGLLLLNYAYSVTEHLQLGARGSYSKFEGEGSKGENTGLSLGVIYNLGPDLRNAYYVSVYGGFEWSRYEDNTSPTDRGEEVFGRLSFGKRFPLTFLNLENVTYSPEVAMTSTSSTKSNSSVDWSQDLAFKFLQFSVFF